MIKTLKTDPKLPHHYIISVGMHPVTAGKEAGKLFLKHGPVYFHNNDVDRLRDATMMAEDKVFKTTQKEALKMYDVQNIVASISVMKLAAVVNQCTVHHFSSTYKMHDEDFETLVTAANVSPSTRRLLDDSDIHSRRHI